MIVKSILLPPDFRRNCLLGQGGRFVDAVGSATSFLQAIPWERDSWQGGAMEQSDFKTNDVDELKGHIRSAMGREYFLKAQTKGIFAANISIGSAFDMHFGSVGYSSGVSLKKNKAISDMTILMPKSGILTFRSGNNYFEAEKNKFLILCGDKCDDMSFTQDSNHRFFVVSMGELRTKMEKVFERSVPPDLSIIGNFDPTSRFGNMLTDILATFESAAQSGLSFGPMSRTARSLRDAAIMAIVEGTPHSLSHWLTALPSSPAPWQIRQAIDVIYARTDDSLTVQDLADQIGIGVRALQLGFRRHKQTSPRSFMKRAALEAARHQLQNGGNSIGEVAKQWGFTNSGRFAAEYRALFNEDPSFTKRR